MNANLIITAFGWIRSEESRTIYYFLEDLSFQFQTHKQTYNGNLFLFIRLLVRMFKLKICTQTTTKLYVLVHHLLTSQNNMG